MSKERLEEIKEDVFKCNHGSTRGYSYEQLYHIALSLVRIHGEWLIKQAERVQELEGDVRMRERVSYRNIERNIKLEQQNKRYREALEFYAEQDNYRWEISYRPQQEIDCMVIDDGGHTARKALKGDKQ